MFKKVPHTYVLIFYIIITAAILTWFIPGGSFERKTKEIDGMEREIVVENSFHYTENNPQTWEIFSALYKGFNDKAYIIVFILIIGGAFWIINNSEALHIGINSFLRFTRKLEKKKLFRKIDVNLLIIALFMLIFSFFGATFGMSEETIAFVIIFVPLSISMGYDSIVGVSMCFVGAGLGFAGAILNPFTVGIAQGLADIPLFSGIEYRLFSWIVINIVGIGYVTRYAKRIKKDPSRSPVYHEDDEWRQQESFHQKSVSYHTPVHGWIVYGALLTTQIVLSFIEPLTQMQIGNSTFVIPALPLLTVLFAISGLYFLRKSVHFFLLDLLLFTILYLVIGVTGYHWYIMEIASLFLGLGILAGLAMSYSPDKITRLFLDGVKDIIPAALVVGLAGGILIILSDGNILDTLLYYMSDAMEGVSKEVSVGIMYFMQTLINIIIPSGSAQAALTIPIMSPFSDLVGISRQAAVMVFQFGDGFTNLITPTSGVLIGVLGMAKIPYEKWFRFMWPFMLILIVTGILLLIPTVTMELSGF